MNKRHIQSEETKKRFSDAARTLFTQKGYKATSIEDIIALAGGSRGNIYYHFESKEGLFLYLLEEWDREFNIEWEHKVRLYTQVDETLYALVEHLLENDLNHPLTKAADEFFNVQWNANKVQNMLSTYVTRHIESSQKIFKDAIEKEQLPERNSHTLAVILEALFIGLSEITTFTSEDPSKLYQAAISVYLNGITQRPIEQI